MVKKDIPIRSAKAKVTIYSGLENLVAGQKDAGALW